MTPSRPQRPRRKQVQTGRLRDSRPGRDGGELAVSTQQGTCGEAPPHARPQVSAVL
jgi:hypothetical protein